MPNSRVPALIDAIVAALKASADLSTVQVVDGPLVSDASAQEWVFVGYDGDPSGDFNAARSDQSWAGLGAKARNEVVEITGAVLVQRGNVNVKAARDRAYVIAGAVEAVLRADPSLGFPPPTVAAFATGDLHQEQPGTGVQARIPFTVSITTRI